MHTELGQKSAGKRTLGKFGSRAVGGWIIFNLIEIGCEGVDWIRS
jgi:hypothetical protein